MSGCQKQGAPGTSIVKYYLLIRYSVLNLILAASEPNLQIPNESVGVPVSSHVPENFSHLVLLHQSLLLGPQATWLVERAKALKDAIVRAAIMKIFTIISFCCNISPRDYYIVIGFSNLEFIVECLALK